VRPHPWETQQRPPIGPYGYAVYLPPPPQHTAEDGSIIRPDAAAKFTAGDAVRHSKWGDGRIVAISGEGEDAELTIAFPGEGIKKFVQKYAPILKL